MGILLGSFVFVFGTIIGSFLNVVALRYNTGLSLGGRSKCFSCGRTLEWYELVPVLSFLALRGKCVDCGSKISFQYPAVELLTGFLFLAVFLKFQFLDIGFPLVFSLAYYFTIMSLLIVIVVYDMKHKIIPDGIVYAFVILSLGKLLFDAGITDLLRFPRVLDLLAGPLLYLPFFLLWLLSRGTWMGLGDAKLALGIGWMMGLSLGISSITLGFWVGAFFSILVVLLQRFQSVAQWFLKFVPPFAVANLGMKSEIPFAPFLILGMLLVFFFQIDVLGLRELVVGI